MAPIMRMMTYLKSINRRISGSFKKRVSITRLANKVMNRSSLTFVFFLTAAYANNRVERQNKKSKIIRIIL